MKHNFNDGGRAESGFRAQVNDCACRAISIACRLPYGHVYLAMALVSAQIEQWTATERTAAESERTHKGDTVHHFLARLGWTWTRCGLGSAAVHLRAEELPPGRIIVALWTHLVAVIDGELYDTFDCSRFGVGGVEGYFSAPEAPWLTPDTAPSALRLMHISERLRKLEAVVAGCMPPRRKPGRVNNQP